MSAQQALAAGFTVVILLAILLALAAWPPAGRLIQGALLLFILVALVGHTSQLQSALDTLKKAAGL
jgi:hypothetical protein